MKIAALFLCLFFHQQLPSTVYSQCDCNGLSRCIDNMKSDDCSRNCQSKLSKPTAIYCFQNNQNDYYERSKNCLLAVIGCSNRKQRHVDSIFHREKRQSRYGSRRILSDSLRQEVVRYSSCIAQCSDGPGNAEKRRRPRRGSGGGGRSGHRSGEYKQRMSNSDRGPNVFSRCLRSTRCYPDERFRGKGDCHSGGMERSESERKTMCSCLQNVYGPDAISCDDSQQSFGGGGGRNTGGGGRNTGGGGGRNTGAGNNGGGTGNGVDNGNAGGGGGGNGGVPTRPPDYDII